MTTKTKSATEYRNQLLTKPPCNQTMKLVEISQVTIATNDLEYDNEMQLNDKKLLDCLWY